MNAAGIIPASNRRPPSYLRSDSAAQFGFLYAFLCCAASLLCIWVAYPFADAGFNDDWNYAWVALRLLQTGRIDYGHCCNSMILFQSYWGAAWIHVFGFSFDLLRIASLPFSLGFVWLVYALARKAGLGQNLAFFGSLVVATSPLFIPMAGSFMTEPYACFFSALCIYAAICSAEAATNSAAIRWLWILAGAGILGGSDRQTVWAAPFALIPYLFWVRRSDRRFMVHAAVSYSVCIGCLAFFVHRFNQPYGPVLSGQGFVALVSHNSVKAATYLFSLLLSGCLVGWPVLLCVAPQWKKLTAAGIVAWGSVSALITILFGLAGSFLGVVPFLGNMLSSVGILAPGTDALGFRPSVLPIPVRLGLTCLLIFSVIAAVHVYNGRRGKLPRIPKTVFIIFSCSYIPLLFPGALLGLIFDRYVLPLFPVMVISALILLGPNVRRVPIAAWACVLIFAGYSITTTHDYFSALRARVLSAQTMEKRGIPRIHISAGLEPDGWTQLQVAGQMEAVKGGTYPDPNLSDSFWLWNRTKAVQPDYVAFYPRASDLPGHEVLIVPFTAWLPPFRRVVVVVRRADLPKPDGDNRGH